MTDDDSPVNMVSLANAVALDSKGVGRKIGYLWESSPVILVFLRHFACIACRAHATQIWKERDRYEKTGAKLVFIGNGSPNYIEIFRSDLNLDPAVVLTDPSLASFHAAGFKRGFFRVVQPQTVINAARLVAKGFKQAPYTKAAGTHWQLGGIVAVRDGRAVYQYISHSLGDFPPDADVEVMSSSVKK